MTHLVAARLRNCLLVLLASFFIASIAWISEIALRDANYFTGWLLLSITILLWLFNVRKAITVLPLLRVSVWTQLHIYLGILSGFIFLLHTEFRWPNGIFEIFLWIIYVGALLSGVIGLGLERILPRHRRINGELIPYDQIDEYRGRLASEVENLCLDSVSGTGSTVLSDFYLDRLKPYFIQPKNMFACLLNVNREFSDLMREIESLERYLDKLGRKILNELKERVLQKNQLDYERSLVLSMRVWLFVHIPLAYGALLFVPIHIATIYAFSMYKL